MLVPLFDSCFSSAPVTTCCTRCFTHGSCLVSLSQDRLSSAVSGLSFCCVSCCILAVVQSLSHVQLFATPWTAAHQAPLSSTIPQNLIKLMSFESVMLSNHLILCHPVFSFCFQSFPALWSSPMSWVLVCPAGIVANPQCVLRAHWC